MNWVAALVQKELEAREYYGIPLVLYRGDPFDGESISHHTSQPRPTLAEEAEAARKVLAEIRKMQVQCGIMGIGGSNK